MKRKTSQKALARFCKMSGFNTSRLAPKFTLTPSRYQIKFENGNVMSYNPRIFTRIFSA